MRDPVVVDRLRHETREARPVPHVAPETFMEAAEDNIANWLVSDRADQIRDLSDEKLAAVFNFLFHYARPDVLLLNDVESGTNEVVVHEIVRTILNEQAALAQEEWESRDA